MPSDQQLLILHRQQQVAELRLHGWSQQAIADRLGVTQKTVSNDLKAIRRRWEKSVIGDFAQARAEELQKIEIVEREAWTGWESSQKAAQSAVIVGDDAKNARKTVKNQHGNPRFLQVVHDCIRSRRAILGLDAPRKLAPTDVEGRTLTLTDLLDRIHRARQPEPAALPPPLKRANVIDVTAELARRAPPPADFPPDETPTRSASEAEDG
ncbi:MAG: hypothetical protein ACRD9W_15185 [Terriglobia bacterium]